MTDLIEVKTARLIGVALDWAVTKAAGLEDTAKLIFPAIIDERNQPCMVTQSWSAWSPSTDWSQGGPLFDKYDVLMGSELGKPLAIVRVFTDRGVRESQATGPTKLVAACRAIVASTTYGDTVQVPKELIHG